MAKRKSWFNFVKSLFISEAKPKPEKKSKKWRWFFGRNKIKHHPALVAPQSTLSVAREEQRKHALNVAIATVVAAEAAVAAAHAAAEVVRLTGASPSYHLYDKRNMDLAAIRIQSAYRGHLARKAFRALKGLVRLQALVRGRIVRHQAMTTTSKCLPYIANVQLQAHERKVSISNKDLNCKDRGKQQILRPKEVGVRDMKLERNGQRSWDESIFSVEDTEGIWSKKPDAIAKRERMKKYSFSHRERRDGQMLEDPLHNKENGRLGWRYKQWVDKEASKSEEPDNFCPTVQSTERKQDLTERLNHPFILPRRSFGRTKQKSVGDDDSSFPGSPVFPSYMAATESAKAKARSMSMPKQRLGFMDTNSDHNSPHKNRRTFLSLLNEDSSSTNRKCSTSHQISVSMKGIHQDLYNVSFGSRP